MNTELDTLSARLRQLEQAHAAMQADNAALHSRLEASETRSHRERRRLRVQAGLAFGALVCAVLLLPTNRAALAQGYGVTLQQLTARMSAVESKTQFVSVTGGEMYVKGTNLHVENGLPNPGVDQYGFPVAPALNGKGNLIIGYNALRSGSFGNDNTRTGSHNLILGDLNNFSSFGGLVAGLQNTISGRYACVTSGTGNTASGDYACVSGGRYNTARGLAASVTSGDHNTANGGLSFVTGGQYNTASNDYASVTGGAGNNANGLYSSVTGGAGNTASGNNAFVSGGVFNAARGDFSSVTGGYLHTVSNHYNWAAGGLFQDE